MYDNVVERFGLFPSVCRNLTPSSEKYHWYQHVTVNIDFMTAFLHGIKL